MSIPITPQEVLDGIKLPNKVIDAINDVIKNEWVYGKKSMNISQDVLIISIMNVMGINRGEVISLGYLDFESEYRKSGWVVEYHKPVTFSNDNFKPYFKFTVPESDLK